MAYRNHTNSLVHMCLGVQAGICYLLGQVSATKLIEFGPYLLLLCTTPQTMLILYTKGKSDTSSICVIIDRLAIGALFETGGPLII